MSRQLRTPSKPLRATFPARRRPVLATTWRELLPLVAALTGAVAGLLILDGPAQLAAAVLAGFATATLAVGWIVGFDVRSLTWLWGAWGEEQTAAELGKLDDQWCVVHDIARGWGSWDRVLVGPGGVFVLDTKTLGQRVRVEEDALRSGRVRYSGERFRSAALSLHDALAKMVPRSPWVQAVVVVWGDFDERFVIEHNVVYVAGAELVGWLEQLPPYLDDARSRWTAHALGEIATGQLVPRIAVAPA